MYEIRAFNPITAEYIYYNSFKTFSEAVDERDRMERIYKTKFYIFFRENAWQNSKSMLE